MPYAYRQPGYMPEAAYQGNGRGRAIRSYFYDDATNAGAYLPQIGPNVGFAISRSVTPSRVRTDVW